MLKPVDRREGVCTPNAPRRPPELLPPATRVVVRLREQLEEGHNWQPQLASTACRMNSPTPKSEITGQRRARRLPDARSAGDCAASADGGSVPGLDRSPPARLADLRGPPRSPGPAAAVPAPCIAAGRSSRLAAGYLHLATTGNASGLHRGWLLLGQGGRHAQHAYPDLRRVRRRSPRRWLHRW